MTDESSPDRPADDRPVLDNHCHLDPEHGRGLDAVEEFADAGGTHLLVVNKPSWQLGIEPESGADFRPVFETTIAIAEMASEVLDGRAWPVLGVHPALVSKLVDERGLEPEEARKLMIAGLEEAAACVDDDRALALKSGRPHYEVSDAAWEASNAVMKRAFELGAEFDCAVQLHTESSEDLTEIAEWASDRGLEPERVVKHFAGGTLRGPTPSVIARKDELAVAAERGVPFFMETDFLDDPDRPGAVLGLKTVPRRVRWLAEEGYEAAIQNAHVDTPKAVYGIDTEATLEVEG